MTETTPPTLKPSWAFLGPDRRLRNGWWAAFFFLLLAAMLFPLLLISDRVGHTISIWEQALLIGIATVTVQALRRKPITEVTGRLNLRALKDLGAGLGLGCLLMAVPAAALWGVGAVRFEFGSPTPGALISATLLMTSVALAEELLFRGVLFQRFIAGLGVWPAQVAIGLLFVLTHLGNPGMVGLTRLYAGVNIFLASILFGLAFLRTGGLAMPIGLHFAANITQGVLLGFGVSGNAEPSLLSPHLLTTADGLTGGAFGLEASIPGLLTLTAMLAWFALGWRPQGRGYEQPQKRRLRRGPRA